MTSWWNDPQHPLWRLLEGVTYFVMLAVVMYIHASSFDETEIQALVQFAGIYIGFKGIKMFAEKTVLKPPPASDAAEHK